MTSFKALSLCPLWHVLLKQSMFFPFPQEAGPEVNSHNFGRAHQSLPSAGRSHWLLKCIFQFYSLFLKGNQMQLIVELSDYVSYQIERRTRGATSDREDCTQMKCCIGLAI